MKFILAFIKLDHYINLFFYIILCIKIFIFVMFYIRTYNSLQLIEAIIYAYMTFMLLYIMRMYKLYIILQCTDIIIYTYL